MIETNKPAGVPWHYLITFVESYLFCISDTENQHSWYLMTLQLYSTIDSAAKFGHYKDCIVGAYLIDSGNSTNKSHFSRKSL